MWLVASSPAIAADLAYVEPAPAADKWQISFTPYGWMINVNGDVTARGHTADINQNFFQIVEDSDSLLAWMSYFEARKGRFALFTDVVWMDLGFPGSFQAHKSPFKRFPRAVVSVKGKAQLDYQSTIIQSGVAYEVARWQRAPGSYTALDVLGGARYWNQDLDASLHLTGTLTVDLERLGLKVNRSRRVAPRPLKRPRMGRSGGWSPHQASDRPRQGPPTRRRCRRLWRRQPVLLAGRRVYGFDTTCLGTPLHAVIGYRALAVDYSERGRYGKDGLDVVQHGPVMGVTFNW